MHRKPSGRRNFLKSATAGIAASTFVGLPLATGTATGAATGAAPAHPSRPASAAASNIEVTSFGAKGDGKSLDSPAINKAIEAAATAGGGNVVFPAGSYLCFSIHLKSNIALVLSPGATILAADPPSDPNAPAYDLAESNAPWEHFQDFGHNHWHNSLIWGEGLENVGIVGPGLIHGKGLSRGYGDGPKAETPGVANKSIALKNCRNVLLRDFSILHGGHFGILATGVDNFHIDSLKIDTNRDGIDVDCCRNVRISNCSVNSPWDDAICPKSSFALGYARSTEFLTIDNCYVTGNYEEGTLLDGTFKAFPPEAKVWRNGRIKFGTESNGGFRNITVSNCVFDNCQGLALESVDGALLEDVTIANITMRGVRSAPIFMRLGARMRGPAGVPVGTLRRITISNLVCSGAEPKIASIISGIADHPIEDLKLENIIIEHQGGGTVEDAKRELAEKENAYPEPTMFGATPAHGFFLRHVQGIEMNGVKIISKSPDARPAFYLDDVRAADFFQIKAPAAPGAPVFSLHNVREFSVARSKPVPNTDLASVESKNL
ncbi:MAG TPA: glycoside hydrolase family 28 protein [Candidatus Acidoferrales bacterium]|nr:glycoside hydrolase family 28 protein [Candidatus Acidoferrales bacterium]